MNKKNNTMLVTVIFGIAYTQSLLCMENQLASSKDNQPPSYEMSIQMPPPDYEEFTAPQSVQIFDQEVALRYIRMTNTNRFHQMMITSAPLDNSSYQTLHTTITTDLNTAMRNKRRIKSKATALIGTGMGGIMYGIWALILNLQNTNPNLDSNCASSGMYNLNTSGQFVSTFILGSTLVVDGMTKTNSLDYQLASLKVEQLTEMKRVLENTSHN